MNQSRMTTSMNTGVQGNLTKTTIAPPSPSLTVGVVTIGDAGSGKSTREIGSTSQSLPAAKNESLGQLFVVSKSLPILDFSNNLEATKQISKISLKCMPSPNIRSRTRRRGSRIVFARDTERIPNSDDQDSLNGDGRDLGGTHLGRIVCVGGRQFLEKVNSARKNFPMKVFLLLLGFYTANALAVILGQTGD
ncbi:putative vacuolar amino acid transporter 1-like [Capsicum annuum]|nr:putative vacuolar amino acid transporter 1-like [Capsicum annuum]KAF3659613.1 putative vacuolar amino acid transporter 1-like [Capsicum annuum]